MLGKSSFGVVPPRPALLALLLGAPLLVAASLPQAQAQTIPSMLYVGTLDGSRPTVDTGEYFDLHEYRAEAGETIIAYLHSTDFDPYLVLLDPQGEVLASNDDGPGMGLDSWLVAELGPGTHTFAVTSAGPGAGYWELYVATGVEQALELSGTVHSDRLRINGGRLADVRLLHGRSGETVDFAVESWDFDAVLHVAGPGGHHDWNDDAEGLDPRLTYTFAEDGLHAVFVASYGELVGAYSLEVRPHGTGGDEHGQRSRPDVGPEGGPELEPEPQGEPRSDDRADDPVDSDDDPITGGRRDEASSEGQDSGGRGGYSFVGNTWIFQTMSFPSAFGGTANEFVRGHLSLYPAGRYDMQLRIGEFLNRYSGAYTIEDDVITLDGYGDFTFAVNGLRATLWNSAGSIFGLALEGSCEDGICAIR